MPPKRALSGRSSRSSALKPNTKPTAYSSKDAAFEQELIDNGVYPPEYDDVEPGNLKEIITRLGQPRASLSPSKFSRENYLHFRRRNDEATTEAEVMSQVFPMITGKTKIPSGYNRVFNNFAPLSDYIFNPQLDYFNGPELIPKATLKNCWKGIGKPIRSCIRFIIVRNDAPRAPLLLT